MKALVRPAQKEDIDGIIILLRDGLDSRLSPKEWRGLFEYPRVQRQPNLGFVLESRNRLVGFLGAVYSERLVGSQVQRFCNLTSWYVIPEFRTSSIALLMALLGQRDYTFTNLAPSQIVTQIMKQCGFKQLESHKLLCGPWLCRGLVNNKLRLSRNDHLNKFIRILEMLIETPLLKGVELMRRASPSDFHRPGVRLLAGPDLVRSMLSKGDQQLLDDHRQCGHFLVRDEQSYSYLVTVNRKMSFGRRSLVDFVVSDVLHFSSTEPALQHWESLCQLIVGHEGSHAVVADERLFGPQCPQGLRIPYGAFFLSKDDLSPRQVDNLYTEMALLDLLMYV
jgi:acetoacetyl-CoA synthetase